MMDIFQSSMLLVFKIAGPMLIASIIVGLVIAIFQAATQIHEQTLTFVPKLLVISLILLLFGSVILGLFDDFFRDIFARITEV